jgi:hypothetical protein
MNNIRITLFLKSLTKRYLKSEFLDVFYKYNLLQIKPFIFNRPEAFFVSDSHFLIANCWLWSKS